MLVLRSVKVLGLSLVAAALTLVVGAQSWAEEPAPAAKEEADASADKNQPEDPFKAPEGGAKELLGFIREKMSYRPQTREQAVEFQTKGIPALRAAGQKLRELATDEDKQLEGFDDAMGYLLLLSTIDIARAEADEQKKLIGEIKAAMEKEKDINQNIVRAAINAAMGLERANPDMAAEAYREFGALMAASEQPNVAEMGRKLEGSARRLSLLGKQMEIAGTQLDGAKFDWAQYRGKVVLVDFWATWCGPCVAELPNVRKNYEDYHDRGFDVIGISLDNDAAALQEFVKKEGTPWTILYDGPSCPAAEYYGIVAIPTAILVDRAGNVVSMNARGAELGRLLKELIGTEDAKQSE